MQYDRELLLKEYFELMVYLNRDNKHKDQQTKMNFKLESRSLFVFIEGNENQKLLLCNQEDLGHWVSANYSRFSYVEYVLADIVTRIPPKENVVKKLSETFMNLLFGEGFS